MYKKRTCPPIKGKGGRIKLKLTGTIAGPKICVICVFLCAKLWLLNQNFNQDWLGKKKNLSMI